MFSLILFTCPNHLNCAVLTSSVRDPFTFIFSLFITVFVISSLLEIPAERRQKSISVECNLCIVPDLKFHVSDP
ncbi:hypothetical protein C0J52_16594 [Blattella germanica]|nr:hypothetical protein C0J52_16594 [Blattella germanica]